MTRRPAAARVSIWWRQRTERVRDSHGSGAWAGPSPLSLKASSTPWLLIRRTIGQATGCGASSTPRPLQPSGDTGLNRSVKSSETRERVVVRMAGDSGDGMQLAGSRFTDATAVFGNDLATLPDFPAEIRAPAGTVAGVSAFQIHFASRDILTPGDTPDVLVAMNPAALKANLGLMRRGATILVNEDAFSVRAVQKAGYTVSPLGGRDARGLHDQADPDELADHAGGRGDRGRDVARRAEGQEPVRARRAVVALRPADRRHREVDPGQVRRARDGGQPGRVPGGLELRRDVGADRRAGQGRAQRRHHARHVPQHQRHRGDGAGPDRGVGEVRPAAGVRRLSDHARVGPAALAGAADRTWACARCRPRTRSRPRRSLWAPRSAARWA